MSMIDLEVQKDVVYTLNIGKKKQKQTNKKVENNNTVCLPIVVSDTMGSEYIKKEQNKTIQKRPGKLEQ